MPQDYYEILGVQKGASPDDIKKAYRRLARQYHPDVNKEKGAEGKFKEITKAYAILSDPNKRQQYDYTGQVDMSGFGPGGNVDFEDLFRGYSSGGFGDLGGLGDLFETFLGGGRRGQKRSEPARGEDLRFDLSITLEEAYQGIEKEINLPHNIACPNCKGSGSAPGTNPARCSTCGGSGQVRQTQRTALGSFTQITTCPSCHGAGETIGSPCPKCKGRGAIHETHKVKVRIPAGIEDSTRLRVAKEGNAGFKGGPAGDLYVFVSVKPHAVFQREGANLYYNLKITFPQAALGGEIEVPTLERNLKLKIPSGTQPGTTFRIKGAGMPSLQSRGKGDLNVLVDIEVPKIVNQKQKEILEKYAELSKKNEKFNF
jgi:molecular chaperone DnaJ